MEKYLPKILICDDDKSQHVALKVALGKKYDVKSALSPEECFVQLKNHHFNILLLDLDLGNGVTGLDLLPKVVSQFPDVDVAFFSGNTDFSATRKAMQLGAVDYIPKSGDAIEIELSIERILENRRLRNKNKQADAEVKILSKEHELIGDSPAIQKLKRILERVRPSSAAIYIHGETGTGKEVVARSLRRTFADGSFEPFVAVDSGTIQSTVAESILFGYEKGAFTGAEKITRGLFEEANGGTIYFDEIANMPMDIQNKLLRVLQEKEVLRLGSSRPIPLEFRVICATHQDLQKNVDAGMFRADLLQRINVIEIEIPPLRDRPEDIPLLVHYFVERENVGLSKLIFLPETIEVLKKYPFPGNVRELKNLILYLYTLCESEQVTPLDLPPKMQRLDSVTVTVGKFENTSFYGAVDEFEKKFLKEKFIQFSENVLEMAKALKMDRSYLYSKLKKYEIYIPS